MILFKARIIPIILPVLFLFDAYIPVVYFHEIENPHEFTSKDIMQKMIKYNSLNPGYVEIDIIKRDDPVAFYYANVIYLSSPMINFVENENELAFLIGHELAHHMHTIDKERCEMIFTKIITNKIIVKNEQAEICADIDAINYMKGAYNIESAHLLLFKLARIFPQRKLTFAIRAKIALSYVRSLKEIENL